MATIEIRADAERMRAELTNDEWIVMLELEGASFDPAHYRTFVEVLAKFVWQDGDYLPYEQARPLVGKLTLDQTLEAMRGLAGKLEDVAVPPPNGATSARRSNTGSRAPRAGSSRSTRRANGARRPGK